MPSSPKTFLGTMAYIPHFTTAVKRAPRSSMCNIASHHYAAEYKASTRILYLTPFLASVVISAQFFLTHLASSSTVLRHVFLCSPFAVCLGDSAQGFAWLCHQTVFAV